MVGYTTSTGFYNLEQEENMPHWMDNPIAHQVDAWRYAYEGLAEKFKELDEDKDEFPIIEPSLTIKDILSKDIRDISFYIKKYIKERNWSPLDEYNLKCLKQVK